MRIMGLDVGDKIIGIAISDSMLIDQPRERNHFRTPVSTPSPGKYALGGGIRSSPDRHRNPMHMNGKASRQGDKVMKFGGKLAKALDLPVVSGMRAYQRGRRGAS